uniref:Protein-serine/threonine kinase n=1 Tax=Bionectria ochroleuca TaxID=29856 RepID=A0A8H7TTD6_BIOOC
MVDPCSSYPKPPRTLPSLRATALVGAASRRVVMAMARADPMPDAISPWWMTTVTGQQSSSSTTSDLHRPCTQIKRRHDSVVTTMAQGILEYKRRRQRMQIDDTIQSFLDRFYMSRIGIRMLIGQHIALTDQSHHRDPTYVGVICTKTNVQDLAQEAIENARFVCEDHYGLFEAPRIQLVCNPDLNFMYVPGHLSHMLFETLKNSLRAVVETHGMDKQEFPVTKVIVAEGKEDITIKVTDEGGGIPRSAIPLVWTYMYTTVDRTPNLDPDFDKSDFKAPMAGFGYGLPISRLYARYFGGDLKLISMEGYGTDVYLHLNRLSSSSEPLQ